MSSPSVNTTELVLTVPEPMTARDLNKATRSFSAARLVGRGRNAAVYRATLPSGAVAAAKRLETPPFGSSSTWSASRDSIPLDASRPKPRRRPLLMPAPISETAGRHRGTEPKRKLAVTPHPTRKLPA